MRWLKMYYFEACVLATLLAVVAVLIRDFERWTAPNKSFAGNSPRQVLTTPKAEELTGSSLPEVQPIAIPKNQPTKVELTSSDDSYETNLALKNDLESLKHDMSAFECASEIWKLCPAPRRSVELEISDKRTRAELEKLNVDGLTPCQQRRLDRTIFESSFKYLQENEQIPADIKRRAIAISKEKIIQVLRHWNHSDEWEPVRYGEKLLKRRDQLLNVWMNKELK